MEEQKTLTDQVLAEQPAPAPEETKIDQKQIDNLQMAENIMSSLMGPFSESLLKLGNNELRKLLKLLVQFPFVDPKKFKLTQAQKVSFMFGERLVYANMVKRARAEIERTFGEVEKEKNEEQSNKPEEVNVAPAQE